MTAVIGTPTNPPSPVEIPGFGLNISECIWTSTDGTLTVGVGPHGVSKDSFDSFMKQASLTAVSGVGDSAFALKLTAPTGLQGAAGIVVLKNGTYFTVQAASKTKSNDALMELVSTLAKSAASKIQ